MEKIRDGIKFDPYDTWWIEKKDPRKLFPDEIKYVLESDDYQIVKRYHETLSFRDFYFLFEDYSQLHISIQYDKKHPRKTAQVKQQYKCADYTYETLDYYSKSIGFKVLDCCRELLGKRIDVSKEPFVPQVLNAIEDEPNTVAPTIYDRTFGLLLFEFRPNDIINYDYLKQVKGGDIIVISCGKFTKESGIGTLNLGKDGDKFGHIPYVSVLSDFDLEKNIFRVIEEHNSKVVQRSIFLNKMKEGELKVFRAVDRNYLGW